MVMDRRRRRPMKEGDSDSGGGHYIADFGGVTLDCVLIGIVDCPFLLA